MDTHDSRRADTHETLQLAADVEINAPRQAVWDLIKPAENAPMFDAEYTRAFRAEGSPNGAGEIQIFISNVDGRERVSAIEVIEEIPGQYAVTRTIGGDQLSPFVGYFLSDTATGSRLEQRYKFVVPREQVEWARPHLAKRLREMKDYLQRAKVLAESRTLPESAGIRVWDRL